MRQHDGVNAPWICYPSVFATCAWLVRRPAAALDSQAKHAIPRPFGQDPMNTKASTAAVASSSRRGDEVPMADTAVAMGKLI